MEREPVELVRAAVDAIWGQWDSVRYEAHAMIELGDRVVMPYTSRFRGRDGIELETEATWVWTIRNGALSRLELYQDLDEALEAAR